MTSGITVKTVAQLDALVRFLNDAEAVNALQLLVDKDYPEDLVLKLMRWVSNTQPINQLKITKPRKEDRKHVTNQKG